VDILSESTNNFEKDLSNLTEGEKESAIQKINHYAELFQLRRISKVYLQPHQLPLPSVLDGYDSSLFILKISQTLKCNFNG
jgi:hypothetical protein